VDSQINFDENTIKHIINKRCDKSGVLNFLNLSSDMILKTFIDFTGSIMVKWHIKQAIKSQNFNEKDTMMIEAIDNGSYLPQDSEMGDKISRHSKTSCKTSSEVGEAIRKVVIKKAY